MARSTLGNTKVPLLNWGQIQGMDKQNIEFGSHTMTHPRLDWISENETRYEIRESKMLIENQLGHAIQSFAYPYGRFAPWVKSIAQEYFRIACSAKPGLVSNRSDRFALERIEIGYLRTPALFSSISNPWFLYYLKYRGYLRKLASRLLNREWE